MSLGRNRKIVSAYLNYRIRVASFYTGFYGRDLSMPVSLISDT
jgi:hypothetical protein